MVVKGLHQAAAGFGSAVSSYIYFLRHPLGSLTDKNIYFLLIKRIIFCQQRMKFYC